VCPVKNCNVVRLMLVIWLDFCTSRSSVRHSMISCCS